VPHAKAFAAGFFYPALTFPHPIFGALLVLRLRKGRAGQFRMAAEVRIRAKKTLKWSDQSEVFHEDP